jgi:hypothetical protein
MTSDTLLWILVAAALVQFAFTVMTYRLAQQAFRAARGELSAEAPKASRAERDAGERLALAAKLLREKVQGLPPTILGPGGDGRVRGATLWTPAEIAALKPTVPSLLARAEETHGKVVAALTWLLAQAEAIRATPRGSGQYLIDFPHDRWGRSYQEASEGLQELAAIGEAQGS